jgi:hypothetical protein
MSIIELSMLDTGQDTDDIIVLSIEDDMSDDIVLSMLEDDQQSVIIDEDIIELSIMDELELSCARLGNTAAAAAPATSRAATIESSFFILNLGWGDFA